MPPELDDEDDDDDDDDDEDDDVLDRLIDLRPSRAHSTYGNR